MSNLGNKQTMALNIRNLLTVSGKSQKELCRDLGFRESTFSDWINAKTYPRIDKIEIMANYFGVTKSDLVEDNSALNTARNSIVHGPIDNELTPIFDDPDIRMLARRKIGDNPAKERKLRKMIELVLADDEDDVWI